MDKSYWFGVVENENDSWYYGSDDLEEAIDLAKKKSSDAYIVVIDDTDKIHPHKILEIKTF